MDQRLQGQIVEFEVALDVALGHQAEIARGFAGPLQGVVTALE